MDEVKAKYNLDEALTKIVEKQIKDLTDEAFASWKDQFSVIAKSFERTEKQSKETAASKIVEGAKVEGDKVPNSQSGEESLIAKARKVFVCKQTVNGFEF